MGEFYVCWRADLKEGGVRPETRFQRVVEELTVFPKIVAPVFDLIGEDRVAFGFAVDGFDSPLVARDWAERGLRQSLHHARVGDPDVPDRGSVAIRVCLEDHPTIRLMATDDLVERR